MSFLAILSPAEAPGPFLIDCYDDEPWRSLRTPAAARRDAEERTASRAHAKGQVARRYSPQPFPRVFVQPSEVLG